jgi:hypothetical protein
MQWHASHPLLSRRLRIILRARLRNMKGEIIRTQDVIQVQEKAVNR